MTVLKVLGFTHHTWNKQHANREFFVLTSQTFPCEFVVTLGILLTYCKALFRSNVWWLWVCLFFFSLIYLCYLPFPVVWKDFQWAYSLPKQRGNAASV